MFKCSVVAFQVYFLQTKLSSALFLFIFAACLAETDPNDIEILNQFKKCLENPELLNWPLADDPCGPQPWPHIFCRENRVTQIQVRGLGLSGCLPPTFNKLSMLINLGLQQNRFSGPLPSFSGLSELQYAYLDFNNFTSIPSDFFSGLVSLQVMALDENSLNGTSGWSFPDDLQNSLKLRNLSCIRCNLVGPLPGFLGKISSLSVLKLSMNRITGVIPASFMDSGLQILWLNDQSGGGIGGTIDVVTTMVSLSSLWLHGNNFTGKIPQTVEALTYLKDLNLNGNKLTGVIPNSLANMKLDNLDLNNNILMGRIPEFKATKFSYQSNFFCQTMPNVSCAPQVTVLLHFLDGLGYPLRLVSSWSGNEPCQGPWLGLGCTGKSVSSIILPKYGLSGTLSPVLASLSLLVQIKLEDNNLTGQIPASWTYLKSLRLLNLSRNNLSLPLPEFSNKVKVITDGNLLLNYDRFGISPSSQTFPETKHNSSQGPQSKPKNQSLPISNHDSNNKHNTFKIQVVVIVPLVIIIVIIFITIPLSFYYHKKRKVKNKSPSNIVIPPQDPYEPNNLVKITIASKINGNSSLVMGNDSVSGSDGRTCDSHVIEAGNLIISVQVLRNVTKNFAPENELGRGGFGIVYEGEFDDGAKIAVKRMEAGFLSSKALDEFHAEIAVLSKVRHRHLVSLLGYSVEENERILVYEYMPKGALSKHLFHWKKLALEPLSWKRRLNIALDVARGMEYLHSLAHQSFIHRDLKSSNILIDDDYRAKVSDFGLVKLAPDGEKSLITKLAGTFGYLAPEYAVTGKITTKSDVFSFGVVVMELLTGRMALDEERPEESQYLPAWFHNIKSSKDELRAAVDQALDLKEDFSWDGFLTVAQLAGHCTSREPTQRPDMGHAVSVLSSLVDQWKPWDDHHEDCYAIDFTLPLNQLVKGWKEAEGVGMVMNTWLGMEDTKDSIPVRPTGFADPFSSTDGR